MTCRRGGHGLSFEQPTSVLPQKATGSRAADERAVSERDEVVHEHAAHVVELVA
jgi:hypothetical protein